MIYDDKRLECELNRTINRIMISGHKSKYEKGNEKNKLCYVIIISNERCENLKISMSILEKEEGVISGRTYED